MRASDTVPRVDLGRESRTAATLAADRPAPRSTSSGVGLHRRSARRRRAPRTARGSPGRHCRRAAGSRSPARSAKCVRRRRQPPRSGAPTTSTIRCIAADRRASSSAAHRSTSMVDARSRDRSRDESPADRSRRRRGEAPTTLLAHVDCPDPGPRRGRARLGARRGGVRGRLRRRRRRSHPGRHRHHDPPDGHVGPTQHDHAAPGVVVGDAQARAQCAGVPRARRAAPTLELPNPWVYDPDHPDQTIPQVFLVKGRTDGWLKVLLPVRPNGSTGWVRSADVSVSRNPYRIEVSLGEHRIRSPGRPRSSTTARWRSASRRPPRRWASSISGSSSNRSIPTACTGRSPTGCRATPRRSTRSRAVRRRWASTATTTRRCSGAT